MNTIDVFTRFASPHRRATRLDAWGGRAGRHPALEAFAPTDPLEQMALEDRDDWVLLRLVVCVAVATLAMAVAVTLPL